MPLKDKLQSLLGGKEQAARGSAAVIDGKKKVPGKSGFLSWFTGSSPPTSPRAGDINGQYAAASLMDNRTVR